MFRSTMRLLGPTRAADRLDAAQRHCPRGTAEYRGPSHRPRRLADRGLSGDDGDPPGSRPPSLARSGSLFLHCDPAASHYLKILLDGIFGPDNFRNEIVWRRTHAHGSARGSRPCMTRCSSTRRRRPTHGPARPSLTRRSTSPSTFATRTSEVATSSSPAPHLATAKERARITDGEEPGRLRDGTGHGPGRDGTALTPRAC